MNPAPLVETFFGPQRTRRPVAPPFGPLKYLYVGSEDVRRDADYYTTKIGADLVWEFDAFGARVAALRLGPGPLLLLADHRPPRSVIYIYEVKDLAAATKSLDSRGWKQDSGPFEVPDGPCVTFKDPSGNEVGLLQPDRPNVLETEFRAEMASKSKRRRG